MDTSIVLASQMNLKDIINKALADYYARRGKKMPEFENKLQIQRHDFFQRKHLGVEKIIEFFGSNAASAGFEGNWTKATLSDNEMYVMVAVRFREAAGASDAAASALDFGTPTVNQILTGLFNIELNGVKVLEDQPVSGINQFNDVPDTMWLPRLEVIENSNDLQAALKLAVAAGDYWGEFHVIGFKLFQRS